MAERYGKVGDLVRRGILLFSGITPIPAASVIAAVAAALISKTLDVHHQRVTDALSEELSLTHISYAEPDDRDLLHFYTGNPLHPDLGTEFQKEIQNQDYAFLRKYYLYLYTAFILHREIPRLLFHHEIEDRQYRKVAEEYEALSRGFAGIQGTVELKNQVNHFAMEFLEVLNAVYEAARDELKTKDNRLQFDLIDYIREVVSA